MYNKFKETILLQYIKLETEAYIRKFGIVCSSCGYEGKTVRRMGVIWVATLFLFVIFSTIFLFFTLPFFSIQLNFLLLFVSVFMSSYSIVYLFFVGDCCRKCGTVAHTN